MEERKNLLPKFLFDLLREHKTSLGDNPAFPDCDDFDFDYTIIKKRFNEVADEIEGIGVESLDEDYLMTELSSLVRECQKREKPMKDTLEKMCENLLNRLFAIPMDLINMSFSLVGKIEYKNPPRTMPESNEEIEYTFKDLKDIEFSKKSIAKRRFINSLIMGASYMYMKQLLEDEELNEICNDMIPLYKRLIAINDYLLFIKKEKISDENPRQGSYVEVHVGVNSKKTTIEAQGLVFPLLLQESIRGLFELFSANSLPKDVKKANYIIKKSDFILAEPWDMRFGKTLWEKMFGDIEDTNLIPYIFTDFIKLPADDFNEASQEILASTEMGEVIKDSFIDDAEYQSGYQMFKNRVNARNVDKAVINDGYFTAAEISGLDLGDDETDKKVVAEDEG